MRVAFLLGAGVSVHAGMPATSAITKLVLSGEGFTRRESEVYCLSEPNPALPDEYTPRVLSFLSVLNAHADCYLNPRDASANYEDLFYLADQIHGSEIGYHPNPAIQPFIDEMRRVLHGTLQAAEREIKQVWKLNEFADVARNYVRDVVVSLLDKPPDRSLDYLGWLRDACRDGEIDRADFFTLNHDLLLERFFGEQGIPVIDGFDEPVNFVRMWNPALYEQPAARFRLLKLHGAINWEDWKDGDDNPAWVGIFAPGEDLKVAMRERPLLWSARPIILAGTFNKPGAYSMLPLFSELHHYFYRFLQQTHVVVVCGYGFGDVGVNARLVHWMGGTSSRQMIVLHKNPKELRTGLLWQWNQWYQQGRLKFVTKWAEEVEWNEIKDAMTD